jgi:hypothetical protein
VSDLPRWVLWLAVAASVVAVVVGLFLDPRGFTVNLLASVVAIIAGVGVAVRLIDPIIRARRRREWLKVADATLAAIRTHVIEVVVQFWVGFGGPGGNMLENMLKGRDVLSRRALVGMDELMIFLRGINPETETDSVYDDVKWDLGQIRDVLIPRVILTADDESLVTPLVALEDAERRWAHYLIGDQQAVIGGTLRGAIDVLEASRTLYAALLEHGGSA